MDDVVTVQRVNLRLAIACKLSTVVARLQGGHIGSHGQSRVVHLVAHRLVDVVLASHLLFHHERGLQFLLLANLLTYENFEHFVHHLRTQPATHATVVAATVLMQHTDHITRLFRSHVHQLLYQFLRLFSIVDVVYQVTDVVNDHDVGMICPYPFGYQVVATVNIDRTDIENKQQLLGKFLDVFSTLAKHHRAHAFPQDGLR